MKLLFNKAHIVFYCILGLLLTIGSCKADLDLPDSKLPILNSDNFVSSFDTSLVRFEDQYNAILIENISFSIKPLQYDTLKEISFKIYPKKSNSIVDTFTVSYSKEYIDSHSFYDASKMQVAFPVFGLYDAHMNTVLINCKFSNGRTWEKTITIETKRFVDTDDNNVAVSRTSADIDYSYLYINTDKGPMLMDIEGNIRWAAKEFLGETTPVSVFLDNHFYCAGRSTPFNDLIKLGFNGSRDTISVPLTNYPETFFHHEMGFGPKGFLIEVSIREGKKALKKNSVLVEVDTKGKLLQTWDMDEIIGKCLEEAHVPIKDFIRNATNNGEALDWFHMNSSFYDKTDNTVLISSRENFIIKVGYDDKEIKWILGDTTKFWYSIDTLRHYTIHLDKGNINIGQHCLSMLDNGELLLFNNGDDSTVPYFPKDKLGATYTNSMISSYKISGKEKKAVETFNLELSHSSPTRGSVEKNGKTYLTSSLPVMPEYRSLINIFDDKRNLLLEIRNYSYFCNKVESFSNKIKF